MNRDSEALQRSLLAIIQDLVPDASLADVERLRQAIQRSPDGDELLTPGTSNFQDATSVDSGHSDSNSALSRRTSSLELGESSTVQDRFHALLKRRLETEIQRNPPLFPWETELLDYETEAVGSGAYAADAVAEARTPAIARRAAAPLWLSQLQALSLPVVLPDAILAQLFQRCQEMVHSSLLEGAKLVRAVEDLFPDQSQTLNHLAGMVITSPARSPEAASTETLYPSYEAAIPAQQMVLSLLAAREIFDKLTMTVTAAQPVTERQWLTELGALTLRVEYDPATAKLRVQGTLPCTGSLLLRGNGLQAIAQRLDPGLLSVELFEIQPDQRYALEVQFADQQQAPLAFAIRVLSTAA
jgi:hypothetical protein